LFAVYLGEPNVPLFIIFPGFWVGEMLPQVWQCLHVLVVVLEIWIVIENLAVGGPSHDIDFLKEIEVDPGWLVVCAQKLVFPLEPQNLW
jgi:hypothetical protein